MDTINRKQINTVLKYYLLVSHGGLRESARCFEVWLSALYGNRRTSSIRSGRNLKNEMYHFTSLKINLSLLVQNQQHKN